VGQLKTIWEKPQGAEYAVNVVVDTVYEVLTIHLIIDVAPIRGMIDNKSFISVGQACRYEIREGWGVLFPPTPQAFKEFFIHFSFGPIAYFRPY
jgi:hypothetical protein